MARQAKAYIAGIYEHPTRKAVDKTVPQLHAEVARGALADAGLTKDDVDGFFCDGSVPGLGGMSLAEYMGLNLTYTDCSETGAVPIWCMSGMRWRRLRRANAMWR